MTPNLPSKAPKKGSKYRGKKRAILSPSRRLLQAQEEERGRIGRELHDGTGQNLMVLRLHLEMLAEEKQEPQLERKIREALRLLDHTVEDLRRMIGCLSPRVVESLGLLAAIREEVRDFAQNLEMQARLDLPKTLGKLDPEAERAIYRGLQEALHNVAKHSSARNFFVGVKQDELVTALTVKDDGVGFSPKRVGGKNFGLAGMQERIASLGGEVQVRSGSRAGTTINILLPSRMGPKTGRQMGLGRRGLGLLERRRTSADSVLKPLLRKAATPGHWPPGVEGETA
jgi:signal transduction histidine kinase